MSKFVIQDRNGTQQEVDVEVEAYKAAGDAGLSLSEYLSRKYDVDETQGTAFEQMMAQSGLYLRSDTQNGIRPPSMADVLAGTTDISASAITRGDGTGTSTPSGRLLFPEIIMQSIRSELDTNYDDFLGGYNSMIAQTQSVTSPKIDQPIINVTAPKASAAQEVAQIAEPASMVTITVSDKVYKIPTKAIGLTISDEALQASTLDLVGISMTAQARQERVRVVEGQLTGMIAGDADLGETALTGTQVTTTILQDTAAPAGTMTQKAWVKYLRNNYRKMSVTNLIMDIDTAIKIDNRSGQNLVVGAGGISDTQTQIGTGFVLDNLGIAAPRVLLVDNTVLPTDTIVGIDRRFAIRRVINVNASYSAIEQYVMRKATSFRVDFGEIAHKLYGDAWYQMTIS